MGKSTLGLALGLNIAETLLAPAMPSTSARAGGIFMPIIKSLSESSGSFPGRVWAGFREGFGGVRFPGRVWSLGRVLLSE